MNFPGFTAEDSLYNTSGHHIHPVPNRFGTYQAGNVMPQIPSRGGSVFCHAGGCHCNSDEACNNMFSEPGLCGADASCNEHGCHCSF